MSEFHQHKRQDKNYKTHLQDAIFKTRATEHKQNQFFWLLFALYG